MSQQDKISGQDMILLPLPYALVQGSLIAYFCFGWHHLRLTLATPDCCYVGTHESCGGPSRISPVKEPAFERNLLDEYNMKDDRQIYLKDLLDLMVTPFDCNPCNNLPDPLELDVQLTLSSTYYCKDTDRVPLSS